MIADKELISGAEALGVDLSQRQVSLFHAYAQLIEKWNKAINLVSPAELPSLVTGHFLDALSLAPHLNGRRLLDVGTGAGFPGIPLAIVFSEKQFDLLDSREKRIHFLRMVAAELSLENVSLYHARVEAHKCQTGYDQITARAFSSLENLVTLTQHLLKPQGQILAMKGKLPQDEIEAVEHLGLAFSVTPLRVPGLNAERHLVTIASHV